MPQLIKLNKKPVDLDPLKFEIQEECTCECCEDIKYFRKNDTCRDLNMEDKKTCQCGVCTRVRKDYYLFYADNLKPEAGCLCQLCRALRNENDP